MAKKTKTVAMSMWKTTNCSHPDSIFLKLEGYSKPIAVGSDPDAPWGHRTLHKALVTLMKSKKKAA